MISNDSLALVFSSRPIKMSPRFVLGRENVPCVAEVVDRSLKADCTDYTLREVQPLRLLLNLLSYHFNRSEPNYKSQHIKLPDVTAACNQLNVSVVN